MLITELDAKKLLNKDHPFIKKIGEEYLKKIRENEVIENSENKFYTNRPKSAISHRNLKNSPVNKFKRMRSPKRNVFIENKEKNQV